MFSRLSSSPDCCCNAGQDQKPLAWRTGHNFSEYMSLLFFFLFSSFFSFFKFYFIFIREEIREVLFSIQCCHRFKLANEAENVAKCKVEEIRKIF